MVHSLKKHYYTVLLLLFSLAMLITKAPFVYMEQGGGGVAFWIYGWIASAILVGLHECKTVLLDYTTDKTKVPVFMAVIKAVVWGVFVVAVVVEWTT